MIIGIDLGTTNSSVSYFTEDGAKNNSKSFREKSNTICY